MEQKLQELKPRHIKEETICRETEEMQNMCAANGETEQFCGKHRRRLELFCQEDEAFICVLCVPKHSRHTFVIIQEAVSLYKEKLKTTLSSLESKVNDVAYLQKKREKEILQIQEDAFNLEQYIKEEFAKLHQFLQDKEQNLMQQLKNEEVNILKEIHDSLACISHDTVTVSGVLKLISKDTGILKEERECGHSGNISTRETFHNNLEIQQQEPPGLLTVPETFEDVVVAFSEEEWKMLRKQDKDLYREVMVQNYETLLSVGYKIPPKMLLLLLKADNELQVGDSGVEVKDFKEQKNNLEDNTDGIGFTVKGSSSSKQVSLGKPHHPKENLQECSQPMKGCDSLHSSCVALFHSEEDCTKRSECDNGTLPVHPPSENQKQCTQPVKGCDSLHTSSVALLQSEQDCSKKSECDNGTLPVHPPSENQQQCAQPVKSYKKLHTTYVPLLHLKQTCKTSSDCDTSQTPPTEKEIYKYVDCSKGVTSFTKLKTPQTFHTRERPHKCAECGKCFIRFSSLQLHQVVHTEERPYKCAECGKCFAQKRQLQYHQNSHVGNETFKCSACNKCFTCLSNLRQHYAIHSGEKPFKCAECNKSFPRLSHLRQHHVIHTGEKPYKCGECGKCFAQKVGLKQHQNRHTGNKPYKCTDCSKSFACLSNLRQHIVIHTGEKPYKCAECSKSFPRLSNLRQHRAVHAGDKPHKCTECGKGFTQKGHLKNHQQSHTGSKPYECAECSKHFTRKEHLKDHQRYHKHHQNSHTVDKPYKCAECNKCFRRPGKFQQHQTIHTGSKHSENSNPFSLIGPVDLGSRDKIKIIAAESKPPFHGEAFIPFGVLLTVFVIILACFSATPNGDMAEENTNIELDYRPSGSLRGEKSCTNSIPSNDFPVNKNERQEQMGNLVKERGECLSSKFVNCLKSDNNPLLLYGRSVAETSELNSIEELEKLRIAMEKLEVDSFKLKRLTTQRQHFEACLSKGIIPRGLRVLKMPTYGEQYPELLTRWQKLLRQTRTSYQEVHSESTAGMDQRSHRVNLGHKREKTDCREREVMQNPCACKQRTEQCCGEHRERLQLFCQEDEAFICVLCVPKHSSHSFVFFHEAVSTYKDKLKAALTSLESKVEDLKCLQKKQEKKILAMHEDRLSLEHYIKTEFAKLHHFLQDKEQLLVEQLTDKRVNILKEVQENLECIKQDITAFNVTVSDGNLELNNKKTEPLKEVETKAEWTENDNVAATKEIFDNNLEPRQQDPVGLLTVPQTFEDVAVSFSEEEWKILRKQDKELYREVMVQNYENLVSVGYDIHPKTLLLLLKAENRLQEGDVEGKKCTEQKGHLEDNLQSIGNTEKSMSRDQQSLLGAPKLKHQKENPEKCAKPVKAYKKFPLTPTPQLNSGNNCKTSECGTSEKSHTEKKLCKYVESSKGFASFNKLRVNHAFYTKEKPYKCAECGKCFIRLSSLQLHHAVHTGEKPYKCTECGKCFAQKAQLKYHQNSHTVNEPYKCTVCSKCFTCLSNLRQHYAIHTGEKPYKCNECNKCFPRLSNLRQHHVIHTGEKPYKCSECGKCFTQKGGLKHHQNSHTGNKPYKCGDCSKSFTCLSNLRQHIVIHTGEKPFKCAECNKSFPRLSNLRQHRAVHTGEKPYKCTECGKGFTQKGHLKNHQWSHTGNKPYECPECSKCFTRKEHLKDHQRYHTGYKPYKCAECSKCFTQKGHLKDHQNSHTGNKPYKCSECSKCFARPGRLRQHQTIHTGERALLRRARLANTKE
ncbi:zinc finger protein 845-like [Protopterus annectens]|uniref:zinc finger protein 845-like n=1 Tax=Protopterus annectens TaxID=7888 RepID=UPI001CF9C95F|nr:zinc finger protein 845-like [Protopterus annectens]